MILDNVSVLTLEQGEMLTWKTYRIYQYEYCCTYWSYENIYIYLHHTTGMAVLLGVPILAHMGVSST